MVENFSLGSIVDLGSLINITSANQILTIDVEGSQFRNISHSIIYEPPKYLQGTNLTLNRTFLSSNFNNVSSILKVKPFMI